jgi:hypothetical protein
VRQNPPERETAGPAPLLDADDHRAFHHRLQSAAHRFDFWQFGQCEPPPRAGIGEISGEWLYCIMAIIGGALCRSRCVFPLP